MSGQQAEEKTIHYREIPEYPKEYTSGSMVARLIDGLGYRYYWATESLTKEDLLYKPSEDGKSTQETLYHIGELSEVIVNTSNKKVNKERFDYTKLSLEELREKTLQNLYEASQLFLGKGQDEMASYAMVFETQGGKKEFPFWHAINGPISDAIYHVGQLVAFRRASGNPMNSKVSVFMGKNRE